MAKIPQRIVSLAPSNTEILFDLGLGAKVVGVTRYCNYPEGAKEKEIVDGFINPDLEKVIALKPDLILAYSTLQKPLVSKLEERGQNVFWFYTHTVNDILESFERIGEVTGKGEAAQRLRKDVEARVEAVQERVKNIPEQEIPSVFRVHSAQRGTIGTIGGDAFQTDVYRLAGGKNIFADTTKDYFKIDLETLLKLDPNIIVVAGDDEIETKSKIKNQDGWEGLTAVKTDRVVVIPAELICRPNPRIGFTIERLAKEFHPERFR